MYYDCCLAISAYISKECTAVLCPGIDDAIADENLIDGLFMAKTDINSAFRFLPIHLDVYIFHGFSWDRKIQFSTYTQEIIACTGFVFCQ